MAEGGVACDWKGAHALPASPCCVPADIRHCPTREGGRTVGWGALTSDPEQPSDPFDWQPDPFVKLGFKKKERKKWGEPGLSGQASWGSGASITY